MSLDPSAPEPSDRLTSKILPVKMIGLSLLVGLATITGIIVFVVQGPNNGEAKIKLEIPLVSIIAVGAWALMAGLAVALPRIMLPASLRKLLESKPAIPSEALSDQLFGIWQAQQLLNFALKEGPGILGIMAYFLEVQPFVLAVPALSFILLALSLPTEAGVRGWIEEQERRLLDMREEQARSGA